MASTKVLAEMAVRISAQTAEFGKAMRTVSTDLKGFTSTVQGASKLLAAFGVGFGVLQIVQGVKNAIGVLATFESTMSEVKAITGATGDEFKALEEDALRLGRSTKFTATQVGQLQIAYGRLGFTTKEILAATSATLDLAAATGEDLAKSADVAGSTVRGFGLQASETQRVVDVMAASFNKTALGLENFTESMKYVAPVAAAAGATVEETTALLGTLADAGIRGSMAGTSLRKIFTDMSKDGRPLQERLAELAKKGITMSDAFDEVGRTAQTSLLILAKNTDKTNELSQAFQNVEGEAARVARIMGDNLTGDVTRLTSAWEGLILKVGNSDPWRSAVRNITGVINAISGVNDMQDNLEILARLISEGVGKGGLQQLSQIIKEAKAAREELGKPIDIRQVEELAQKYKLTSEQANILYVAILDINKALSFQEKALQQFNEFVQRNGYTDLAVAAEDYRKKLYDLILAEQLQRENLRTLNAVDGSNAFDAQIKRTDEQIAAYRRAIRVINEYISTLEAQKKKEEEIAAAQIENLDLYQDLLKKKNEEFEASNVNDKERLRLIAAEIAALQQKIDKLNQIRKLAQEDQVALSSTNNTQFGAKIDTSKLTDQVLKDFDPLKTFFDQYKQAIQDLIDSLRNLKQTVKEIDITNLVSNGIASLAESFGEAAVGVGNFGQALIKSVAGFAKQLGALMIATGIAKIAFDKFSGPAMVAAGIGLIAAASAAQALMNKSSSAMSNTGGGSGSGSSSINNSNRVNETTRAQQIALTVEPFAFKGADLWLMLKNYEKNSQYTSSSNG